MKNIRARENGKGERRAAALSLFLLFALIFVLSALSGLTACAPSEKKYAVVCWGDSLTWGTGGGFTNYPSVLENLLQEEVNKEIYVANAGVGGESSATICARAGVYDPLALAADAVVPADTSEVAVELNYPVLRQGGSAAFSPCIIGGIEGSLRIEQAAIDSETYRHYFKRSKKGEETELAAGTLVESEAYAAYENYVSVIFIGQNGGWADEAELIAQQRALVERSGADREKFLILGLTSGSAASRASLESAMEEAFGERYINLRAYLSGRGMADAELTATEEDAKQMAAGVVPESLRSDEVHLNADGYRLVATIVYKTMERLGFTEDWKEE